jgi:tetratricopeptide (TPR) repeat protein
MVRTVAESLRKIAGPLEGLRFLLTRAENEPRWLSLRGEDFWARHASLLGQCFHEAERLDRELEGRLLAVVLEELREDLRTETSRSRYFYHDNHAYFWSAQSHRFAEMAQQVIRENRRSEGVIRHAAAYLYDGLDRADLAIGALLDANDRYELSLKGRLQLSRYLQWQNRYAESVPILVKMIEDDQNNIEYRSMLMRGYFHTGKSRRLKKTLKAADDHFHRDGRWQERTIATLGSVCLETELFERAIDYYQEAIALHVKTAAKRGVGDGVLSPYYRDLAGAFSGLGRTAEAVDAAAGAIVAWGPSQHERARALQRLENVLRNARDLDDYVAKLDADAERTGLENPLVRKAVGKAYLALSRPRDAAKQLRWAVNARPNDLEARRLLVTAYDRARMPERAVEELLAAAEVAPREIGIYRELGDRWQNARRERDSERAYTSIVEAMPNESESHQLLAGVREQQRRLRDASHHWRKVTKIRSKEPTGYLELARVLITLGDWDEARTTVDTLRTREWPERFGNLTERIRELERTVTGAN